MPPTLLPHHHHPSLLVADEQGSMRQPTLAEKGTTTVDKVDGETAKVIKRLIPQQHNLNAAEADAL